MTMISILKLRDCEWAQKMRNLCVNVNVYLFGFLGPFSSQSRDNGLFLKLNPTRSNEYSKDVKIFTQFNSDIFGPLFSQSRDNRLFLKLNPTRSNEYSKDVKIFTQFNSDIFWPLFRDDHVILAYF